MLGAQVLVAEDGDIIQTAALALVTHMGAQVTVLEMDRALGKDDPELAVVVLARLRAEGVAIHEQVKIQNVEGHAGAVTVTLEKNGAPTVIKGSHLLVATGRQANVEGLDLEAAGVEYSAKGIRVDARLH